MIEVAEIASGGEIIPPNKKPNAKVKPGMKALDTNATTQDVIITMGKAKLVITRLHFQNSFHDTCQAASYKRGGRKMKKTSSGSIVILEKREVKLRINPPTTSTMGYAMPSLLDSITRARMIRIRKMYCIKRLCMRGLYA
jgi:hypothetical protein